MFPRILLVLVFAAAGLYAAVEHLEFLAEELQYEETSVRARGDVTILGDGYVMQAKEANYDKKSEYIDLQGDVIISRHGKAQIRADKVRVYVKDERAILEPFYIQDDESGLWISARKAMLDQENYAFEKAILTSCCVEDPLWHIEASRGTYDTNSSWVSVWNPRLYLYDAPLLYFPYMGFPADQRRRSGLLYPSVGYSEHEGLLFQQPIYLAPDHDWDVEIRPQVRTDRGEGLYGRLRFADSEDSRGSIDLGYFKEKSSYHEEYNLKHILHHGFGIEYENGSLLSNVWDQIRSDGLYVDALFLSDSEHISLQDVTSGENVEDKYVVSKLNYFMRNEENYLGFYAKHYFDTSTLNNDETLQTYPMLQYHRFTNTLLWERFLYSVDVRNKNYHRPSDLNAIQHELEAPFGISLPVLGNYLTLEYTQSFYLTKIYYDYKSNIVAGDEYKDAEFARTYHEISAHSDLLKRYSGFTHQLQLFADYTLPGYKTEDGYFADFIELPAEEEELILRMNQFYYDSRGKERFFHRFKQPVYFKEYTEKYGEMENEFVLKVTREVDVEADLYYSHEHRVVSVFSPEIVYEDDVQRYSVGHYYKNRRYEEDENFFQMYARRKVGNIELFGNIKYDQREHEVRWWQLGAEKKERCYTYRLIVQKDSDPILTKTGAETLEESFITLEFALTPLGGMKQKLHRIDGQNR